MKRSEKVNIKYGRYGCDYHLPIKINTAMGRRRGGKSHVFSVLVGSIIALFGLSRSIENNEISDSLCTLNMMPKKNFLQRQEKRYGYDNGVFVHDAFCIPRPMEKKKS
jgi:hypothetical protein